MEELVTTVEEVKKKSVADIIIEKFLKDVDEKGTMPWQRPYERYNSFNYFTGKTYRGINRLLLPFGEYLTKTQINEYNRKHNEDFRFQKGIEWYPVVFFTVHEKEITKEEFLEVYSGADITREGYIGTDRIWNYFIIQGKIYKRRNVLKYSLVAERKHFKNSKGEYLPSRLGNGEVTIDLENPKEVLDSYVAREGIEVITDSTGVPCYKQSLDRVELNPHVKSEEHWFSIAFHEFAHSTGHPKRLNRRGFNPDIRDNESFDRDNQYAVEECIAEITASLLCAECGIHSMETSESAVYTNNIAYVKAWKQKILDWGNEFIYIVSQADKAFNYILGDTEDKNR